MPVKYVLYFYISTFWSMCLVPNMAVFCISLISCLPSVSLRYCLNDFEMVLVASVITGITLSSTFHMCWIYSIRSLYFRIFCASFLITFLSPEIATSINIHVPSSSYYYCHHHLHHLINSCLTWQNHTTTCI